MKYLFFILFLSLPICLYTQNNNIFSGQYTIKGVIIDSSNNEPIEMAVSSLYSIGDKLIKGAAADHRGAFIIDKLQLSAYKLQITMLGYDTVKLSISKNQFSRQILNLDTIRMRSADIMLSDITILSEPPEMVVKEDTIEYNAAAFKVAEGAVVEDLIKRLPGMDVDEKGNITKPDGKQVRRIFVDGKEFFGDDPKMATKNLTADIIDKVQVIEKKSDMAILTGIDDGEEETIINITVKKGMKQGWMGNITSGLGTLTDKEEDDNNIRYRERLMINRFSDSDQITFIANANNVNNQGSTDRGNDVRSGRRSDRSGITTSSTFGINMAKVVNDKIKFGGNINYNYSDNYAENNQFRQNLLKDSVSYRRNISQDRDYSNNLTFDGKLEYQPDSSTMIILSPHLSYNYSRSHSSSNQVTMAGDIDSSLVNESHSRDKLKSDGFDTRLNFDISRKLSKEGRRISLGTTFGMNKSTGSGANTSENIFYLAPGRNKNRDQISESDKDRYSYRLTMSYIEPVWTNNFLDFSYNISFNDIRNGKKTLDFDQNTKDYTFIDPDYNKSSNTKTINQNFTVSFRSVRSRYTYNIGLRISPNHTKSKSYIKDWYDKGNDSVVNNLPGRKSVNFAPQLNFTYRFKNTHEVKQNLLFRYNGSTTQPSITQLDPTSNNTNPLHIRSGNPDLQPTFNHNISLNYDYNNRENQKVFTVNLTHRFTQNEIINYSTYEGNTGIQYSIPINENGTWNTRAIIYFSKPFDKKKKLKFSSRSNIDYANRVGFTTIDKQSQRNISKTVNLGQELNLSYSGNSFYGQLRGHFNYSNTSNSVVVNQQGKESFNFSLTYNTNIDLPFSWSVSSDINYRANRGLSSGYNLNETIWNVQLSKLFLKNNKGALRLEINDILQQRLNIRRNITANYIEDVKNNAMTGYFIISFAYRFNNIGVRRKGNPQNSRPQDYNRVDGNRY
jgi:hypothetical protein